MQNSDQTATVPVQGLLAELANQHSQTPKAVVRLQPQPLALSGKPSTPLKVDGRAVDRAAFRMGKRSDV